MNFLYNVVPKLIDSGKTKIIMSNEVAIHIVIHARECGSNIAIAAFTNRDDLKHFYINSPLKPLFSDKSIIDKSILQSEDPTIYAAHTLIVSTDNTKSVHKVVGYYTTEKEALRQVGRHGLIEKLVIDAEKFETPESEPEKVEAKPAEHDLQTEKIKKANTPPITPKKETRNTSPTQLPKKTKTPFKKSRKEAIFWFVFPVFLLICCLVHFSYQPTFGQSVNSVEWLPKYASEISYIITDDVHIFECTMSRLDFGKWTRMKKFEVKAYRGEIKMERYLTYLDSESSENAEAEPSEESEDLTEDANSKNGEEDENPNAVYAKFETGYTFSGSDKGKVTGSYNPQNNRLYCKIEVE